MSGHPEDAQIQILTGEYTLFSPRGAVVELDLGCGSGSYTAALAARFPERRIIAADVMLGRLRRVVRRINTAGLANVDILRVEAGMLVSRMLPDRSLNRIHLLCPDPWPKERHRGHRLMTSDFTAQLHRVLREEGIFHFSSDDEPCREMVREVLEESRLFAPAPEALADLDGLCSDFERRWQKAGRRVLHFAWRRLPPPPKGVGH